MQALRKIASVLIFPTIAYLGAACERTGTPTEPAAAGVAPVLNGAHASANIHWVNDDPANDEFVPPGTSCENPGYEHVQDAVNAASPGDRINVCPGTYTEQVTFIAGKDGIKLRSTRKWQAIIKAPAVMVPGLGGFAIVRINAAQNVTILGFTITGPGPTGCGSLHYGVRVEADGSANVLGNHIIDIRDEPLSGCQNGVAVGVGRAAEGTSGSAKIIGNVIERYQKNGPTVSNTGSSAEIADNQVFGIGPTTLIAQNGIQVSSGATARVRNNLVTQNIFTGAADAASSGILLFSPGRASVEHNTVTSNDVGIWLFAAMTESRIKDNRVRASTFDGIIVQGSNGHQVAHNESDYNRGPGIGVYDEAQNNSLDDNQVENNHDSGILLDVVSNNIVSKNKVNDNGTDDGEDLTDGIRANAGSARNTIRDNQLRRNVTHDCHDGTDGLLNTWTKNRGETSSPPGLCGKDKRGKEKDNDDENREASSSFGWDANSPWFTTFGESADYDSRIDTGNLLQLSATQRGASRRGSVSPIQ